MTIRATGALLCAVGFLCASFGSAMAEGIGVAPAATLLLPNSKVMKTEGKNPAAKTTTVKSNKSNTSDKTERKSNVYYLGTPNR